MHASKLALILAVLLLPAAASASSPTPSGVAQPHPSDNHVHPTPSPAPSVLTSDCTFTVNFAPAAPPAPGSTATISAIGTQQYPVSSYSLKPILGVAGTGIATVVADSDLISTIAALKDQHAIMSRAAFACPGKSATLVNATVGTLTTVEHPGTTASSFTFTLNYGKPLLMVRPVH